MFWCVEEIEFTICFCDEPNLNRAEARLLKKLYREFARELEQEMKKDYPDLEIRITQ